MIAAVTYQELGHEHEEHTDALSPDYVAADIGGYDEITATVFGYQIGEAEALAMIDFLQGYVEDCLENKRLQDPRNKK